jgi:hypothetical protein
MDKSLKIALGSLGVSLVVPAVKFTAYLNTGSLAPYSDALESIINVATSIARRRPSLRLPQGGIYVGGRHRRARQSVAMPPMLSKLMPCQPAMQARPPSSISSWWFQGHERFAGS